MLASVVNFFNPSLIVVGGGVANSGDQFLAAIREAVYRRSLPLATRDLLIQRTSLGGLAGVLGASAMVVDQLFAREQLARWLRHGTPAGHPEITQWHRTGTARCRSTGRHPSGWRSGLPPRRDRLRGRGTGEPSIRIGEARGRRDDNAMLTARRETKRRMEAASRREARNRTPELAVPADVHPLPVGGGPGPVRQSYARPDRAEAMLEWRWPGTDDLEEQARSPFDGRRRVEAPDATPRRRTGGRQSS